MIKSDTKGCGHEITDSKNGKTVYRYDLKGGIRKMRISRKNSPAPRQAGRGWLLFFYSVPSKPAGNRMKVWRRLLKAGAVPLKGSVYILPFSEERYEFLQWLVAEIAGMKGEGAFVTIERLDTIKDEEIIDQFRQQRANDYQEIERAAEDLERRLSSIRKGTKARNIRGLSVQFGRLLREFDEIGKIDFFGSPVGSALRERIKNLRDGVSSLSETASKKEASVSTTRKAIADYQGKAWLTRKKPFIDRMASAWLIRKFIDEKATFDFIDEKDVGSAGKGPVTFDIRNGDFTHAGDLCTFEVLVKSFGLRDKPLRKMAEIIHDLDMKDDKFGAAEAKGLEEILTGIRKTAMDDHDCLKRGMAVFEMLYESKR